MPKYKLKPVSFLLLLSGLLSVLIWLAACGDSQPTPDAPQGQAPAGDEFWIDLNMQPELSAWFNQVAQPGDMARADQLSHIAGLDEVTVGRKVVVFRSAAMAEQLVPRIADKMQILGYNLEHGPLNPLDEQADPLGSIQRMRALADRYGMELALGPDHEFALSHGVALAPYVDTFILQVQRVQEKPEVVRDFVVPLVKQLRQANPQIKTSMQVRTEGDVAHLAQLIDSLRESLNGASILTSPNTTESAKTLMAALRPSSSAVQIPMSEQALPPQQAETGSPDFLTWPMLALGVMVAVLGGIVIGVAVMLVWQKADKTRESSDDGTAPITDAHS